MISALERLRALRAVKYLDPADIEGPADLPMEWRIEWEERAAILEYDGGVNRDDAERQALQEIAERLQHDSGANTCPLRSKTKDRDLLGN